MDDMAEFLNDFRAESHDGLDVIENEIMAMEGGDEQAVARVFRAMHSMKGGSGFLDLQTINQLAHQLEHLLTEVREGRMAISAELCDLLLRGADRLKEMIDEPDCGESRDCSDLINEAASMLGAGSPVQDDEEQPVSQGAPPPAQASSAESAQIQIQQTSQEHQPLESRLATSTFAMWLAKTGRIDLRDLFDAMMSQEYRTLHPLDLLKHNGLQIEQCIEVACHAQDQDLHPFQAALELGHINEAQQAQLEERMKNSRPSIGQALVQLHIEQSMTVRNWLHEYYEYRLDKN